MVVFEALGVEPREELGDAVKIGAKRGRGEAFGKS